MDASVFYDMWNKSVSSNAQLEQLQAFGTEPDTSDELLSLLIEDDFDADSEIDDAASLVHDEPQISPGNVDSVQQLYETKDLFCYKKDFVRQTENDTTIAVNPLYDSIQVFCKQYDYECYGSIEELCNVLTSKKCTVNESYCEILNYLFGIVLDCAFDESLLLYSFDEIRAVIPIYRNFYLSELILAAGHKNASYFDASVIKYFSLEKRDTGLLLQLLSSGSFDREEAVPYTENLDMFNSYLTLKMSDKFDKALFDSVNSSGNNLNSYTKSLLNDNPWSFLANNSKFDDILKLTSEKDIPLDLAKAFKDNPWVYQILQAYTNGVFSREFIETYLIGANPYAELMANEYANGILDQQVLEVYQGNYYVAKFIHDVKELEDDCTPFLIDAANPNVGMVLAEFAEKILIAIYSESLPESEWYKFIYLVGTTNNVDILRAYNKLANTTVLSFNQFCFTALIQSLGCSVDIPVDIGSLLLFQRGETLSYTNSQMIAECFDKFVESLKSYMVNGQHICILPANTGILVCSPDYDNFGVEEEKFKLLARCKSSLDRAVEDKAIKNVRRYNINRIISIVRTNGYNDVSESFQSLINAPNSTYLLFDDLLDVLVSKLPEFIGLCRSHNAIAHIKYLYSVMHSTNKAVIQIEFLKVLLTKYFGNRISFERYTPNTVLPITVIEVANSNFFSSETFNKVMFKFDDFIADLNRKNKIICRFSELSKISFSGV